MIPLPGSISAQPPGDEERSADRHGVLPCGLDLSFSSPRTGLTVLSVSGEIDTLTAPHLSSALDDLMRHADRHIAIDLDGVTFLASSGLGVLINTARQAAREERRLFVVATSRAVLRPLEVTGSAQLFTVVPDRSGIPVP
ncbi:STAS domain-containing protein [Pseudonocardia sp. NPDC049635]|uniref:STAS domain-containing protein n=1 Tax=Pseudonocardia sp. NPDC049635 TaxID=3155506 RepID=UPI0033C1A281